jgi:hypothetical protein
MFAAKGLVGQNDAGAGRYDDPVSAAAPQDPGPGPDSGTGPQHVVDQHGS